MQPIAGKVRGQQHQAGLCGDRPLVRPDYAQSPALRPQKIGQDKDNAKRQQIGQRHLDRGHEEGVGTDLLHSGFPGFTVGQHDFVQRDQDCACQGSAIGCGKRRKARRRQGSIEGKAEGHGRRVGANNGQAHAQTLRRRISHRLAAVPYAIAPEPPPGPCPGHRYASQEPARNPPAQDGRTPAGSSNTRDGRRERSGPR